MCTVPGSFVPDGTTSACGPSATINEGFPFPALRHPLHLHVLAHRVPQRILIGGTLEVQFPTETCVKVLRIPPGCKPLQFAAPNAQRKPLQVTSSHPGEDPPPGRRIQHHRSGDTRQAVPAAPPNGGPWGPRARKAAAAGSACPGTHRLLNTVDITAARGISSVRSRPSMAIRKKVCPERRRNRSIWRSASAMHASIPDGGGERVPLRAHPCGA